MSNHENKEYPEVAVVGILCLDIIPPLGEEDEEKQEGKEEQENQKQDHHNHQQQQQQQWSSDWLKPGVMLNCGRAKFSGGGCVANSGIAVHKLGAKTSLVARVGRDEFGNILSHVLSTDAASRRDYDSKTNPLLRHLSVSPSDSSSYSVILNPPQIDRSILHHSGANATFDPLRDTASLFEEQLKLQEENNNNNDNNHNKHDEKKKKKKIPLLKSFHYGYPPFQKSVLADHGIRLGQMYARAKKELNATTSLDFALPDERAEHVKKTNWKVFLQNVFKDQQLDIFMPSIDELAFLFGVQMDSIFVQNENDKNTKRNKQKKKKKRALNISVVRSLADSCFALGPLAMVVVKLGEYGAYIKTTNSSFRLQNLGRLFLDSNSKNDNSDNNNDQQNDKMNEEWLDCEMFVPTFSVPNPKTCGAGDCFAGGFLAALVHRGAAATPFEVMKCASASGSFCCERLETTTGIPTSFDTLLERAVGTNSRLNGNIPVSFPNSEKWIKIHGNNFAMVRQKRSEGDVRSKL